MTILPTRMSSFIRTIGVGGGRAHAWREHEGRGYWHGDAWLRRLTLEVLRIRLYF